MILVDLTGHLVSDKDEEELHEFAANKLNMQRRWFQTESESLKYPHYSLMSQYMIKKALREGAVQVSSQELIKKYARK